MPYAQRPYVPAKDPLRSIPPSRHPFQFWVMIALFLNGVQNFVAAGSEVIAETVDPVFHKVWALTLAGGCLTALIGAFWRDRVTGLLMERLGLFAIGISCPVYAIAFVAQTGWEMTIPGTIVASAGVASLWRLVHVRRELRILRDFMERSHMR